MRPRRSAAPNEASCLGAWPRLFQNRSTPAQAKTIFEYEGGLLHTKSLTLDGEVTLIGSANMDRRSFELNYENNILFYDPALTAEMRKRQDDYLARSHPGGRPRGSFAGGRARVAARAVTWRR